MKKNWFLQPFRAVRTRAGWMAMIVGWLLCVAAQGALAQEGFTVTGTVTDATGEPLAGVNIVQKDASGTGTVTDVNGKYSLRATRRNATLTFSYIGFITQDIAVAGNVLDVTMKEDLQNLEEVVVIGYGTAKKRDLTGAISTVKTENLVAEAPRTVQDLLRANSAGVSTTLSSNAKGNASLQIRGANSLKASTSP
ncbi:MAG: carboxypeptidase-like regulatory domain-containing protein, partial [Tannerella sp.]|nr:carboxypeptidase-like regulatory domain-containing protein [Tannerella sp.]